MTPVIPTAVEAASTLAVIAASNEPLLFLNGDLKLIAASASFCHNFQIEPAGILGRALSELGEGEWGPPQLTSLLRATASGSAFVEAYEMNLVRKDQPTRCLLMNATKLDDGDANRTRLLLAITDVTVARAESRQKDDLIREKAILLRRCSTGSPTVFRLSPACSCKAPAWCSLWKPKGTCMMPTTA